MSVRTSDVGTDWAVLSGDAPPRPIADGDGTSNRERVEASRRLILEAIGDCEDVTFVRGVGNMGDHLIGSGTRALLAGRPYREVSLREVGRVRGRLALLGGGGAWCEPYHELMPEALPVLERTFDRVVVLPSSFDLSVEAVAQALSRTRAVVFARERESYRQIRTVCDARLAHDASFFFDFSPWRREGRGVLNAWRTDRESSGRHALPARNVDISAACESLDEWLWTIARHALVRTDRAHVLIAGALLGKTVEYRASSYHKVPEIAAFALGGFPVRRTGPETREPVPMRRPSLTPAAAVETVRERLARASAASLARLPAATSPEEPRVTIILVSWNRPEQIRGVLCSVRESMRNPYRIILIDNNSARETRELVKAEARSEPRVALVLLDENIGCAGARALAVERCATEYVLFLDDDAEIFPGTLELLVHALDADPAALAAAASVVLPDGTVQISGGDFSERDGVVRFAPLDAGRPFESVARARTTPCKWVGGACVLYRRAAFEAFPLDPGMAAYYEDNEWGFRVERSRPGALHRCPRALALHHHVAKDRQGSAPTDLAQVVRLAGPIAHFYRKHGLVMEALFALIPELRRESGYDVPAARLFLELLKSRGAPWLVSEWLSGGLAPLFRPGGHELRKIYGSRWWRLATTYWSLRLRARALLGLRESW
jgi:GT2 family glycosyltransferase